MSTSQSLLALLVAGMICGKQSLRTIARWGRRLPPEQLRIIGIERPSSPSQVAIHNLLVRLETASLETTLGKWVQGLAGQEQLHIAMDGKTIKSSATKEYPALHLLSAYCTSLRRVLYQLSVPDKCNEITVAKDILRHVSVQGNVISGDAMFCQRELCTDIVTNKG